MEEVFDQASKFTNHKKRKEVSINKKKAAKKLLTAQSKNPARKLTVKAATKRRPYTFNWRNHWKKMLLYALII